MRGKLLLCILAPLYSTLFLFVGQAQGGKIYVPEDERKLAGAVAVSSAGDTIAVALGHLDSLFVPLQMKIGVRIEPDSATGSGAILVTSFADTAVVFPSGTYSGQTSICGLSIVMTTGGAFTCGVLVGGASGTGALAVEDCHITGAMYSHSGIVVLSGNSDVTVARNTIQGFYFYALELVGAGSNVILEDNVLVGNTTGGILLWGGAPVIEGNTIMDNGWGIAADDDWESCPTVTRNLVVDNSVGIGFLGNCDGCSASIYYNNAYGNSTLDYDSTSCYLGDNLSEDPGLCDGAITFHVNSVCLPQNNAWDVQIGYPAGIACASGDLDNSVTLDASTTAGSEVLVTSDFRVPSGKALTIGSGVTVEFDDSDESNLGSDSDLNELIVQGELTVNGASGSPVQFTSSQASPAEGDWWGIYATSAATVDISHASIRYSVYGVAANGSPTVDVEYSTLEQNEDYDIFYGASGGTMNLTASHNAINVGGGTGVLVWDAPSGGTISSNTITGNSSSSNGIQTGHMGDGASPAITGNAISGVSNGAAVEVTSGSPTLTQNELEDCKQGVKVSAGNPLIGTSSSSSDNLIHDNTTGILSTCSGVGNCPNCASTAPVIRNNQIYSNTYGVTREKKGEPNLGTDGSTNAGKNSIHDNTTYCIWNRTTCDTIQAQGNWFGGDCSTPPACSSGLVSLGNYLCSEPADEGIAVEPVPEPGFPGLRVQGVWPNPSRAGVTVRFETGKDAGSVAVSIFDVAGRLVRDLGQQQYGTGVHDVAWDGTTDGGLKAPNGLYFVRVAADGQVQSTSKVLVAR